MPANFDTAGDSPTKPQTIGQIYDRGKANGNCASYYKSGWWFDACFAANLNGKYYHGSYDGQLIRDGIYWGKWSPLRDEVRSKKIGFST